MFNESSSDLLAPQAHEHLLQWLWDGYLVHLAALLEEGKEAGRAVLPFDQAKRKAPASHFLTWAAAKLRETPVVENYFIEGNCGLRMADGSRLAVCPGGEADVRGTMQDANDVPVTKGQANNKADVTPAPNIRI
jgi:hypothetical protein